MCVTETIQTYRHETRYERETEESIVLYFGLQDSNKYTISRGIANQIYTDRNLKDKNLYYV